MRWSSSMNVRQGIATCLLVAWAGAAAAQDKPAEKKPSTFDRVWKFADLYDDSSNRVVQRLQLSGRFQLDFAGLDADQGDHSEWNVRRMRIGPRMSLFRTVTFH